MGTRACRNFRSGAAVVRFVGTRAHPHLVGTLASGERALSISPGSVYCPCFVSVVSSPSGFEIFVYYLSGWPLRTYTARPRGACVASRVYPVCLRTYGFTVNSVVRISPPPPGRAISFIPVTVCD